MYAGELGTAFLLGDHIASLCPQHINKYLVEEICALDPTASNVEINVELITRYIQGKVLPNNLNIH